jgi:hypothetical protein
LRDKKVAGRLAAASAAPAAGEAHEPVRVSLRATIVSPSSIVSPLSGTRGAVLHVELVERFTDERGGGEEGSDMDQSLGVLIVGDVVTLRDEDGDEIAIVARRARVEPSLPRRGGTPLTRVPPEVVPILQRASGRGVVCYRELLLREGEAVRLKAIVEPTQNIVTAGHRAGWRVTYVARDDLEAVVLEELLEAPPW